MYVSLKPRPMGTAISPNLARSLFVALYLSYPLGCILQLGPDTGDDGPLLSIIGLILVAISFLAFAVLAGSSFQRQAQEPEKKLDERELAQRNRAAYRAFSTLASVVVLGVFYQEIALDLAANGKADLWTPTSGDHWNALLWWFLLLGLTLPAAFLAWENQPPLED